MRPAVCASLASPDLSVSPVMYNAAFASEKLDFVYVSFDVRDLGTAVAAVRALNMRGVSVSRPFKEAVLPFLDDLDPTARTIGAVNVIRNEEGRLVGYNSDWIGAVDALTCYRSLSGAHAAVIGAGGAGRAVAYGLKTSGADVVVFNRSALRAAALARDLGVRSGGGLDRIDAIAEADVIVNATCIAEEQLVPQYLLRREQVVLDVVVLPVRTKLIADAQRAGCAISHGYEMLVFQGAVTFELFTGRRAPVGVMRDALRSALASGMS